MQVKLSALVISSILVVALGLTAISYYVFCQRVDDRYMNTVQHAVQACADNVDDDELLHFWSRINTHEFRTVRDHAMQLEDETVIANWLCTQPGWYLIEYELEGSTDLDQNDAEDEEQIDYEAWTLMDDYERIMSGLLAIKDYFDADSAYYQYNEGDVTYNIADVDENLFYIGTTEPPIAEFDGYEGNVSVPPIVYHSDFGWLLTAIEPVMNWETMEPIAVAGVDFNMTEIVRERYSFVQQSLVFVAILLAAAQLRRASSPTPPPALQKKSGPSPRRTSSNWISAATMRSAICIMRSVPWKTASWTTPST